MRLSASTKSVNQCARAKAALVAARGVDGAVRRAREITGRSSRLWRGRRVWQIRCTGTSGNGPHELYLEAAVLWSLIDLRAFRCPYHANDRCK